MAVILYKKEPTLKARQNTIIHHNGFLATDLCTNIITDGYCHYLYIIN